MDGFEELSPTLFISQATAFFGGRPTTFNNLPVVKLLLFVDPRTDNYVWAVIRDGDTVDGVVKQAIGTKSVFPVGTAFLTFDTYDGRAKLSKAIDFVIDTQFDEEEVLNGTIPYFLRDALGYQLEDVKFSDLTKN